MGKPTGGQQETIRECVHVAICGGKATQNKRFDPCLSFDFAGVVEQLIQVAALWPASYAVSLAYIKLKP